MPDIRPLNEKKYGISKNAFRTAYAYCLQYPEWKKELENQTLLKSPRPNETSGAGTVGDATASAAARRAELKEKMRKVERAVKTATEKEPTLYPYLLEYVTTEGATFSWIKQKGIPCEKTYFYKLRRYFYWILAQKI